jgi:hypothetical protein
MPEFHEQQFSSEVIQNLRLSGEKSAAFGCLILAGQQEHAITALCLTRNNLNKLEENYETRVMFLNGAVKILEKEMVKNLERAHSHWTVARQRYGNTSKDSTEKKEEALESNTKGSQENAGVSDPT